MVVGSPVEIVKVFADDFQGEIKSGLDVLVAEVETLDQGFCGLALLSQTGLLLIEEFAADAVFVVHVQELSFLLFDYREYASAAINLLASGGQALAEILGDGSPDLFTLGVAEHDRGVVTLDDCFDQVDGQVALWALAALVLDADEVFIGAAVAFVAGVS